MRSAVSSLTPLWTPGVEQVADGGGDGRWARARSTNGVTELFDRDGELARSVCDAVGVQHKGVAG